MFDPSWPGQRGTWPPLVPNPGYDPGARPPTPPRIVPPGGGLPTEPPGGYRPIGPPEPPVQPVLPPFAPEPPWRPPGPPAGPIVGPVEGILGGGAVGSGLVNKFTPPTMPWPQQCGQMLQRMNNMFNNLGGNTTNLVNLANGLLNQQPPLPPECRSIIQDLLDQLYGIQNQIADAQNQINSFVCGGGSGTGPDKAGSGTWPPGADKLYPNGPNTAFLPGSDFNIGTPTLNEQAMAQLQAQLNALASWIQQQLNAIAKVINEIIQNGCRRLAGCGRGRVPVIIGSGLHAIPRCQYRNPITAL